MYEEVKQAKTVMGGPAFWITKTFDHLKVAYQLVTSKKPAVVRIAVKRNKEVGKVVSCPKIQLPSRVVGNTFLVSTIGDEFALRNLTRLKGFIALDIQGYARAAGKGKVHFPKEIAGSIDLLKTNSSELKKLPSAFASMQKQKILVVTRGIRGFQVFIQGKAYEFSARKVDTFDTIGAGDTFLAAFLVEWVKTQNIEKAAQRAQSAVEEFLKEKKLST